MDNQIDPPDNTSGPPPMIQADLDYELYIVAFSILSVIIAGAMIFLPLAPATDQILYQFNFLLTVVLLIDFVRVLRRSLSKLDFMKKQGWLYLLACMPLHPIFRFLLLFRIVRSLRHLRLEGARPIWNEINRRRAQNALRYITVIVLLVLAVGSTLVLQFESKSPDANILTGQEAIWWSIVTVATVGYGDYFPVTLYGRLVGITLMIVGVGMFGVLSSYLATNFLSPTKQERAELEQKNRESLRAAFEEQIGPLTSEIAALRAELSEIRMRANNPKQDSQENS